MLTTFFKFNRTYWQTHHSPQGVICIMTIKNRFLFLLDLLLRTYYMRGLTNLCSYTSVYKNRQKLHLTQKAQFEYVDTRCFFIKLYVMVHNSTYLVYTLLQYIQQKSKCLIIKAKVYQQMTLALGANETCFLFDSINYLYFLND